MLILSLVAVAATACRAPPCKDCASVAGEYTESIVIEPNHAGCLSLVGGQTSVRVLQPDNGPALTIVSGFGTIFDGKLGEDNSVDLDENALQTSDGTSGSIRLNGSFVIRDGQATGFKGKYNYMTSSGSCSGDFATTWTR